MTNVLVTGFMWALVAVLSLRARTRPDNSVLWAAIAIATSFTTNIDSVYLTLTDIGPWPNGFDLAANILLMVGIYYLSRSIGRGATGLGSSGEFSERWIRIAVICAVTAMVIFFVLIDAPSASTTFMLTYGNQLPAALYSIAQYTYIFVVMTGVLVTCIRNVPRMRHGRFKVGFSFLAIGCTSALGLCTAVIGMDIAHLAGNIGLMLGLGVLYNVLYAVTIGLLCIGLGIPPAGRLWHSLARARKAQKIEPRIRRIWARTVAEQSSLSLVSGTASMEDSEPERMARTIVRVHRMVVEIHDWVTFHKRSLSERDRRTLAAAEELCMQPGRRS
ncbi:hypothetical protein [Arthrobacter castelli]|uniref:hypothetical protein n=1 Tax=Arthrobacter castelli TaxID=271431 RepID=UPI0004788515|nr:hypothetical protein [Arthrobacter castelli]